jgi:hypothetical protein
LSTEPSPVESESDRLSRDVRFLTKKEFERLITSGEWKLDRNASEAYGASMYFGPDDQMILSPFIKSDRPRISTGRAEFLEELFNPPNPVTVVGAFYLRTEIFTNLLPPGARVEIELDADPEHRMADFPERYIESDGEQFMRLLVKIGSKIIEREPALRWRVKTSDGIMTSIDLVSDTLSITIDARAYKQIWDRLPRSKIKSVDIEHYADRYLKSPI